MNGEDSKSEVPRDRERAFIYAFLPKTNSMHGPCGADVENTIPSSMATNAAFFGHNTTTTGMVVFGQWPLHPVLNRIDQSADAERLL